VKRHENDDELDCKGAGELSCMAIRLFPLAGTSLGNTFKGSGRPEQFTKTLFENEVPSLETAIATVPDPMAGEIQTARVLERTTAETMK
jgi:hypothetical protein